MSSLVKSQQQQQQHTGGDGAVKRDRRLQQLRRSGSFEKLYVTAFQIRLACSKCSRESLKFLLGFVIMRSRIIAYQLMGALSVAQLSREWHKKLLETADAANELSKRYWSRFWRTEAAVIGPSDTQKPLAVALPRRYGETVTVEKRPSSKSLLLGAYFCIIFTYLQLTVVATLFALNSATCWGVVFLIGCISYIGFILLSIVRHEKPIRRARQPPILQGLHLPSVRDKKCV